MRKTVRVATLLGHAHVEMALSCLGSLLRYSADRLLLRVHEDGSLTAEDRARLVAGLGELDFVTRPEADERVAGLLAHRPALRRFRQANPLALKLIDIPAFAGDDLAYCDSDILFLRPFAVFRFPNPDTGAVFMSDRQNAYSLRSWHLLAHPRLALPCRVNSGILLFRARFYDPDLLEWYFARPEFAFAPVWSEQTAWALLGARAGCRLWDPRLVRLPGPEGGEGMDAVALHFVSPLRGLMPGYLKSAVDRTGEPPVTVGTIPVRRCRPWDLAWTEARRRWARFSQEGNLSPKLGISPSSWGTVPHSGGPLSLVGGPPPTLGDPSPTLGDPSPSLGDPSPSLGDPSPSLGDPSPSLGDPSPSLGDPSPSLGDPSPSLGDRPPRGGTPLPR